MQFIKISPNTNRIHSPGPIGAFKFEEHGFYDLWFDLLFLRMGFAFCLLQFLFIAFSLLFVIDKKERSVCKKYLMNKTYRIIRTYSIDLFKLDLSMIKETEMSSDKKILSEYSTTCIKTKTNFKIMLQSEMNQWNA